MKFAQSAAVMIGAILAFSLISGGLMHALIPHDHGGHHHVGETSSIWSSLHAALRHEDKQTLPIFNMLTVVALILVVRQLSLRREIDTHVDSLMEFLRRGIVPYRRFG